MQLDGGEMPPHSHAVKKSFSEAAVCFLQLKNIKRGQNISMNYKPHTIKLTLPLFLPCQGILKADSREKAKKRDQGTYSTCLFAPSREEDQQGCVTWDAIC